MIVNFTLTWRIAMNKKSSVLFCVFLTVMSVVLCSCSHKVAVRFVDKDGNDISYGANASVSDSSAATENAVAQEKTDTATVLSAESAENELPSEAVPAAEPTEQNTQSAVSSNTQSVNTDVSEPAAAPTEICTEASVAAEVSSQPPADSSDPSNWTVQQIVDCYRNGMQTTDDKYDCYTDQRMQLVGKLPGKASGLSGPVNLAMKLGSQPFNALTGGYWALVPDDLVSATAAKDGKYVVINLVPKEQTDGPGADEHEGHTGHVVNVVQGIDDFLSYVEENFGILHASYTQEGVQIHYRDAFAKDVRINTETGEMESGNWGYTIDLHIDDASVLGISLDDFNATIQYNCWYPVED